MLYNFIVSSFKDDQAVLKDNAGEIILWPQNKLPENISIGSSLYFNIHPQKDLAESDPQLAKNILNEILKIS
ncbi:MAG: hypothetical protein WC564_01740 [Patescibacteria group bacterium]|jgi:hypothetical protein